MIRAWVISICLDIIFVVVEPSPPPLLKRRNNSDLAIRVKTIFNFSETGLCEEYQIPYYDMLPGDPSFDEVKRVVLTDKRRPSVPNRWYRDEVSKSPVTSSSNEIW